MTEPTASTTYRREAKPAERITFQKVLGIAQSLESQGKGRIAKEIKPAAYQLMALEHALKELQAMITRDAPKAELLKVIDVALGSEAK